MRDPVFNEIKARIQFYTKELAKNDNELLKYKKRVLEAAQKFLEGESDRTQFYNVLISAENKGWDKGWTFLSKSSETEKLIMRTLHLADKELKEDISKNINIKPIAAELDEKIIELKEEKLKTKAFNKYDLWSQKIAVLSATKTALENNKTSVSAEVFKENPRWEKGGIFSSNTEDLVEKAFKTAQTSRNISPRSLNTRMENESVRTEASDQENQLYEKLNEKYISLDKAFKESSCAANDDKDTSKLYFSDLLLFLVLAKEIINNGLHSKKEGKKTQEHSEDCDPVEQNKINFYFLCTSLQQKWKLPEDIKDLIKELQGVIVKPTEEFIKSLNNPAKPATVTPKTPRGKGGSALFTLPSEPQDLATLNGTQEMPIVY